jgi:hypothetical protein
LNLILTFENTDEWLVFFNSSSTFLIKCPLKKLFTKVILIFPSETVVLDTLDKKNISELNQYIQYFFQHKNGILSMSRNLLLKESKYIKTLSGRIMWLKPTFFYPKDSIVSLTREKPSRKLVLIYPQKFSLKTELSSLIADKEKVPFYYFLNNEFTQEKIKKRNEYIFMSKRYFCTLTREYHPILFPDSNISFFFERDNRDQLKKNLLPLKNLRKYPIYNYVWRKKISFYEKLFGSISQKPLLFFSSNNNHKRSLLYNVIQKAEKD